MLQHATSQPIDSSQRPVALRMRPDLIVRERRIGSKVYFVIKDPVRLKHHQLWEEEYALLKMLDGRTSIAEMKNAFSQRFPGSRLDSRLLQVLHGQFHRNELVLSEHFGQSEEMHRRNEHFRSQERWGRFRGWMSIRFRGINPDRALEYLDSRLGWCFEYPALYATACFFVFTLIFFAFHGTSVVESIPSLEQCLSAQTIALFYASFICLKALHEIGHGLACKHFGGECNEMGVMLLIFTPCLYCDVTDSWMVESKWKRAMIASAGIMFELVAASICIWIWWFTNPGVIHSLCFQVALVGSAGTLLFNANPLMKYDGYFVLSDLLDRPNLSLQARHVFRNGFAWFFLRKAPYLPADYSGRSELFLWIYGLLAGAYRYVLGFAILLFVFKFFQTLRLEVVGLFLVFSVLLGWLSWILMTARTWVRTGGGLRNLRNGRVVGTLWVSIAILALLVWLPLPSRLYSHAYVEAGAVRSVIVLIDGRLERCVSEGTVVRKGDEIAKLSSENLELNLLARQGELSRQRARLTVLESRRGIEPLASSMIPAVQEAISGLALEVQRLESDIQQLTLRAPIDGTVLAPKTTLPQLKSNDIEQWSGSPLHKENIGCLLPRGITVCEIGDEKSFQATVFLSQPNVELVRPGHVVYLKSTTNPGTSFRGTIKEIGSTAVSEIPNEIVKGGVIATRLTFDGRPESSEPLFAARVEIDKDSLRSDDPLPLHHSIIKVSIQIDSQSIGNRIARFVFSTFAIDPTVKRRVNP